MNLWKTLKNIFKENELDINLVTWKFLATAYDRKTSK